MGSESILSAFQSAFPSLYSAEPGAVQSIESSDGASLALPAEQHEQQPRAEDGEQLAADDSYSQKIQRITSKVGKLSMQAYAWGACHAQRGPSLHAPPARLPHLPNDPFACNGGLPALLSGASDHWSPCAATSYSSPHPHASLGSCHHMLGLTVLVVPHHPCIHG